MRIQIDAPSKRALTPNEQRVYKLLQEGMTPEKIARRLHMCLKADFMANLHDVPVDSVMGLITSMREKGWEIPEIKEEDNMPRGVKTSEEVISKIKGMRADGCTYDEIMKETGVAKNTVTRYTANIKREPAAAATTTDSKVESVDENISSTIVSEKSEVVKSPPPDVPEIVITALADKLDDELRRLDEADTYITDLKAKLASEMAIRKMILENIRQLRAHIIGLGHIGVVHAVDAARKCEKEDCGE